MGANTGLKVVAAGKELWFPNAGLRETVGNTADSYYLPGQAGRYLTSTQYNDSNCYELWFRNDSRYNKGNLSSANKLNALSVRCVR